MRNGAGIRAGVSLLLVMGACTSGQATGSASAAGSPSPTREPAATVPDTALCEAIHHVACYRPAQMQTAYDLTSLHRRLLDGTGITIAIVVSFGSPTIEADLHRFDSDFGLRDPTLTIIHPAGPIPAFTPSETRMGWARETSLDVEWAHAFAPGANILLVETPVAETLGVRGFPEIVKSERYLIEHHLADVISQSFGAPEDTFPNPEAIMRLRGVYGEAAAAGVTVLAGTGDAGASGDATPHSYYQHRTVFWPASDPLVTAVGGTDVHLDLSGVRTSPDTVMNQSEDHLFASGGGTSRIFPRPSYQDGVQAEVGTARGIPDIALSAGGEDDAVLVYSSYAGERSEYYIDGGTSAATPEFAGIVAIADQVAGHDLGQLNPLLYALAAHNGPGLVDVTLGTNTAAWRTHGKQHKVIGWAAGPGYDLASGLGTVDAADLVQELAG